MYIKGYLIIYMTISTQTKGGGEIKIGSRRNRKIGSRKIGSRKKRNPRRELWKAGKK
jgi:hypothetical protein